MQNIRVVVSWRLPARFAMQRDPVLGTVSKAKGIVENPGIWIYQECRKSAEESCRQQADFGEF